MPYATNPLDGARVYYEDDGGAGAAVVLHDGFADSVADLREWGLSDALAREGYRLVLADHRGHGASDRPHDPAAYALPVRVADAVAILDALALERAHFVGRSWGGRLCFGIGEHAPERVRSLVIGGNQPYAWPRSERSAALGRALAASCAQGTGEALVRAFEGLWDVTFPSPVRRRLLGNDPIALDAAFRAATTEGPVAADLGRWRLPCLIFVGAADTDFLAGARRAAAEIPGAELLVLEAADHLAAHASRDEALVDAVLRTLRRAP